MRKKIVLLAAFAVSAAPMAMAATPEKPTAQKPRTRPSAEIIKAAPASDWQKIDPADLLVMTLAPDAAGKARQVIIQLLPPPFSQGWIGNMRKLATAHWWDGGAVYRVQDNWVAQFGDPDEDTPQAKPLPAGLSKVPESEYEVPIPATGPGLKLFTPSIEAKRKAVQAQTALLVKYGSIEKIPAAEFAKSQEAVERGDSYAMGTGLYQGWPVAYGSESLWPVHCYATVGVGRNNSPDTGTGAELYAAIGTPPRQLDRNIAVVGRVIEGIEHLSSLPRAPGNGMYNDKAKNTPILSIRLGSELPPAQQPHFEYLSSASASFRDYVNARANRRDDFIIYSPGNADICNIPIPIRRQG
ncbi:peptidylprolyl isomerase [Novosphingobium sp. KACC 22771]|uniref:peptidylprolyl isomerase n=1 Tax=Novosphingobium sp. KACC 22771 TaxID=3025670 RepID=UPI00236526D3|nr:peptidylprolyl isomerase [Novosphingobium sp. KACC 22771]WDF73035.1 peptidylprolyl isomerase [Novosphingobium sp. KACC 22771]